MRSDEFCWKAGIQNSSLTAPFVGGLAADPCISGLNDATSPASATSSSASRQILPLVRLAIPATGFRKCR